MSKLPKEIKLTYHARDRLIERNKINNYYDTKNLMKSSCKWYGKDDLIPQSALYIHSLYVCRKSKNNMRYITDGNIEVLYNKTTKTAITIMEVKDKFKPITQYIKPEVLEKIKTKKENKKMRKHITKIIGTCPDCGKENVEISMGCVNEGICEICKRRKWNALARGKEYIPYINLSEEKRKEIDIRRETHTKKPKEIIVPEPRKTIPVIENFYQVKAENNPTIAQITEKPIVQKTTNEPSNPISFVSTLKEYGCDIPGNNLQEVLEVLLNINKLKEILNIIVKNDNQQAILNLEETLNIIEKKLQYNWENNGFQEVDDIKFKEFLIWRRVLKDSILFCKNIYSSNLITDLQRIMNSYSQEIVEQSQTPEEKLESEETPEVMRSYQVTTESISTILNTRRPFTRVFYAVNEEQAHERLLEWLSARQLHENKSKTTIIELKER